MRSLTKFVLAVAAVALAACNRHGFEPTRFNTTEALFDASLREYQKRNWGDAARGFEKLTTDLPARDPRLPAAYYYLGKSQMGKRDYITAAQTFQRISDGFPDDTLADDALYEGGRSYQRMWRKPALDAEHGQSALNLYRTLLVLHPTSPLRAPTEAAIARIEQWLATKDYDTGFHYMRRGAYDSAIIYFKDVIRMYPNAPKTREAYLRLLESYREIRYREDARDLCVTMRERYQDDREVTRACPPTG